MSELLLAATGVCKSFNGVRALEQGQLSLRAGTVHALCGGNGAGKSTFLNILMGLIRRDGGQILLKGRPVDFASPADALRHRIAIITQELQPIDGMTVAENLYLGREPTCAGFIVDRAGLNRQAGELLQRLQFPLEPTARMADLSLAQKQLVEIAKAFSHQCDIMIMDEPTSAIGEHETAILFDAIRRLTATGAAIIYVSHRLSEIFQIADDYTVFRDGRYVESGAIKAIDRPGLVSSIVGRQLQQQHKARRDIGPALLVCSGLGRAGEFSDINLTVHQGEILGIYGLMGAGRSEFLNCLYGLSRPDTGQARLAGTPLPLADPAASIRAGLALVTEDRKQTGLVLTASIRDNMAMAAFPRLSRWSWIDQGGLMRLVSGMVDRLSIKLASAAAPVAGLSGGNQQKVVLARCFSTRPRLMLCDEPTRGIDEGAKRELYQRLDEFVQAGGAAIVVSSEAPELLDVSDRIAIFRKGRLVAMLDGHMTNQEELLHLAS